MSKKDVKREGYEKILDAWVPPRQAGNPVGCVATTFTFSPVFFEEECLGRFLQIESDVNEDGPVYIIEREEKLSGLMCASVLVDQHHCKGTRSLLWDLVPARMLQRVMHAKVCLLYWNNFVRLVVGSANITETGYRRNQEIFGVLDYFPDSDTPLVCLKEMVSFLKNIVDRNDVSPPTERWHKFLDTVMSVSGEWGSKKIKRSRGVVPVVVGPGMKSGFDELKKIWPGKRKPRKVFVTSPFFDDEKYLNKPAQAVWKLLDQKRRVNVTYNVCSEEIPGTRDIVIHAPETLKDSLPENRDNADVFFKKVQEEVRVADGSRQMRAVHLKSILFESSEWAMYMIGSSNFTSAGLGLLQKPNYEANLVYLLRHKNHRGLYRRLKRSLLEGKSIDLKKIKQWKVLIDEGIDSESETVVLPRFFDKAVYSCDGEEGYVEFSFSGNSPSAWSAHNEFNKSVFLNSDMWQEKGCPEKIKLLWIYSKPPSGFDVVWTGANGTAWWTVNVELRSSLPKPEKLREMPLEVLIEIITSSRPLISILRKYMEGQDIIYPQGESVIMDPHKKIDTSNYLLKRTRRISMALTALRNKLECPIATRESLVWRLRGPVGVTAFADAINKQKLNEEEKAFLIAELVLELSRVKPKTDVGCIGVTEVKKEIKSVVQELKRKISDNVIANKPYFKEYIINAFEEITI